MVKYIVLTGDETRNTINSVWAVVKQNSFTLESVHLLGSEKNIEEVKDDVSTILEHYDIDVEPTTLVFQGTPGESLQDIIEGEEELALDISGASKSFAAELLVHPVSENFDHVFCLQPLGKEKMDRPYPVMNRKDTILKDLRGGVKG